MDFYQFIKESRISEIVSGNNNIDKKLNNYVANIGYIYGDFIFKCCAFESYIERHIYKRAFYVIDC